MTTRTYTEAQMIAIGGSRWERPGTDEVRVYLNDWPDLIGLDVEHYKTGNIRSAFYRGEPLSNNKTRNFAGVKAYWKSTDGKVWSGLRAAAERARLDPDQMIDHLHEGIAAALARIEETV